jgi:Transposase DDE domain group 1
VGDTQDRPFQLSFNSSLKVDFQGSRVTSDGGLVLVRELDERLGLSELVDRHLSDSRRGKNIQLPLADLLRQSIYSRLAGYEDVNDAARLAQDPTFRLIGSRKIWERGAALTSRLQSFETEVLTQEENLAGLAALNRELVARAEAIDSPRRIVLDMDSTEVRVHGRQERSAYNGHFESTCYHPLLLFNREGDCLAARLRPGNVHSADGWEELLLPEIDRQQVQGKEVAFRGDAAFAKPELYEALEAREVKYAIRLPANDNLQRKITELLTRPVGRPSHQPVFRFKSFLYQAASWTMARRVVGKVEFHCGELFPRMGFIVTSLAASSRAVVRFYNKRGTAEQWIKESKQAVALTRLSCHRFRANEVRLWLSVIAYNLGNLWRRLALPSPVATWSLTSLHQRLVKTGGRLIKHARYSRTLLQVLLAESHLTRRLFAGMQAKIAMLPSPAG